MNIGFIFTVILIKNEKAKTTNNGKSLKILGLRP